MRIIARFTSIICLLLGGLVILGGLAFGLTGVLVESGDPTPPPIPDYTGFIVLIQFVGGATISALGFMLAAVGQGLWLLVEIADHTAKTSAALMNGSRREM